MRLLSTFLFVDFLISIEAFKMTMSHHTVMQQVLCTSLMLFKIYIPVFQVMDSLRSQESNQKTIVPHDGLALSNFHAYLMFSKIPCLMH